ncbi:MAG: hypothetical protein QM775_20375 [Pirellulales bacterium]
MTILHTGSTKAFEAGWRNIFGGGKKATAEGTSAKKTSAAKKAKPAKKAAAKAATAKPKKKAKR